MDLPNELAWNTSLGTKVAWRVKRQSWNSLSVIVVVAVAVYTCNGEECPS